jgi:uncharacterized membrane protein YdjX (TVP38/TMEM64 family)
MRRKRWWFALVLLALICAAAWFNEPLSALVMSTRDWFQASGSVGIAVFFVMICVLVVIGIPETPFAMLAGAAFGFGIGAVLFCASGFAGAMLCFALARGLLKPRVCAFVQARAELRAIEAAIVRRGLRFVLLARLLPINGTLLSYALASMPIRLRTYVAALPVLALHWLPAVYLGDWLHRLSSSHGSNSGTHWVEWVIGVFAIGAVVLMAWYLTRIVREAIATENRGA